jgi:precorrin-4 methylase
LLDEYGKQVTALVIYLAVQMIDAIEDATAHGGPAPAGMFERFLGWDRHKPISDESSSRHA